MSNNQPIYLTAEGLRKVKDELEYLTTTRRREVAQMIAEAKAEGDISENAGMTRRRPRKASWRAVFGSWNLS